MFTERTVPLQIEVKSNDNQVKARRQALAKRVVDEFGDGLPDLRLLSFFDDEDWVLFRRDYGPSNRGMYSPIKASNFHWPNWPDYVAAQGRHPPESDCRHYGPLESEPRHGRLRPFRR